MYTLRVMKWANDWVSVGYTAYLHTDYLVIGKYGDISSKNTFNLGDIIQIGNDWVKSGRIEMGKKSWSCS